MSTKNLDLPQANEEDSSFLMKQHFAIRAMSRNDGSVPSRLPLADRQQNRNSNAKTRCQPMPFRCKLPPGKPMPPAKRFVLASDPPQLRARNKHKTHSPITC